MEFTPQQGGESDDARRRPRAYVREAAGLYPELAGLSTNSVRMTGCLPPDIRAESRAVANNRVQAEARRFRLWNE